MEKMINKIHLCYHTIHIALISYLANIWHIKKSELYTIV